MKVWITCSQMEKSMRQHASHALNSNTLYLHKNMDYLPLKIESYWLWLNINMMPLALLHFYLTHITNRKCISQFQMLL